MNSPQIPVPRVRGILALLGLATLLALVPATTPAPAQAQAAQGVLDPNGQRGVAFVHIPSAPFGSQAAYDSLKRVHDLGANWVSIVASFRQNVARSTSFSLSANDPTDQQIAQMISYAHSLGMKVMLQPIILANDGVWSGYFSPEPPEAWFDSYRTTIASYARLAQSVSADEFCIGTEFFTLTQPSFSGQWRQVIQVVRQNYFGPITYSANWGDKKTPEYATIDWWDQLDYIGISAYFPLSWNNFYTDPLRQGWISYTDPYGANAVGQNFRWFDAISAVHGRWNKPIQFTKIGFASYANSPGRWDLRPDPTLELSVQGNAYEATMEVWRSIPWMTGIFWSPWYSNPNAGGPLDTGESPQNKPAEQVLRKWYAHGGQ
ncbi:MAG TPA: hypothetical protein VKY74_08595 [Chloroflexia bacterium]|nr:hypothetical protein [Chloroflexia bacterium]